MIFRLQKIKLKGNYRDTLPSEHLTDQHHENQIARGWTGSPPQDTFYKRVSECRGLVYETALNFTLNEVIYLDYVPSLRSSIQSK